LDQNQPLLKIHRKVYRCQGIDDSLYRIIDQIIDEHYLKANEEAKKSIRQILRANQTENQA